MSSTTASPQDSQIVPRSASASPTSRARTDHYFRIYDRLLAAQYIRMQKKKQLHRLNPTPGNFLPRMDLYDDGSSARISALLELPGVKYENVNLRIHEGLLLVQGQRGAPLFSRLAKPTPSYYPNPSFEFSSAGVAPTTSQQSTTVDTNIATPTSTIPTSVASLSATTTAVAAPIRDLCPKYYRVRELKFGTFRREIQLPTGVEARDIRAELSEGMLLLSWPRYPSTDGTSANVEHIQQASPAPAPTHI